MYRVDQTNNGRAGKEATAKTLGATVTAGSARCTFTREALTYVS
jgi:hypothetical protein